MHPFPLFRRPLLLAVLFATLALPALRAQTTVDFVATTDTRIFSNAPTYAGAVGDLTAFNNGTSTIQHGLVLFDVSSLSGYNVISATLELTTDTTIGGNNGNPGNGGNGVAGAVQVYRIGSSWSGASWNSRDGTNAWVTSGGDFLGTGGSSYASPYASNSTPVGANTQVLLNFDVTSLVQEWVTSTHQNYGFGLTPQNSSVQLDFWSFNNTGDSSLWPTLSVTYTSAIPEPAAVATGLALFALGAVGVREHRRRKVARLDPKTLP